MRKRKASTRKNEKPSIQVESFFMQKLGNQPSEYEDSFRYSLESGRFAVADGVSESCFAKLWADLLARFFVRSKWSLFTSKSISRKRKEKIIESFLSPAQEEWDSKIDWENLAWYVHEKAKRGAFATFLGLEIGKGGDKRANLYHWRALAVGDCCLFHLSARLHLLKSFPMSSSAQFDNRPSLLPSKFFPKMSGKQGKMEVYVDEGKVKPKEKLVLTTDAVAKWILQETEKGQQIWKEFILHKNEKTKSIFEELIGTKKIRNDDITVLILAF